MLFTFHTCEIAITAIKHAWVTVYSKIKQHFVLIIKFEIESEQSFLKSSLKLG